MRTMSAEARARLTEPWEEFVGYVYDDKRAKEVVNGKRQYVEWDGGPVKGTLTIGFGHTDASGAPKIVQGLRITRREADDILSKDMADCERDVNRLLKAEVTQHQFDAIADTYFNCPSGANAAIKLINAGNVEAVPAKLLQYVCSKGERMRGLVNRRNAEIAWFHTPDHLDGPPEPHPDVVFCPKAERNPPPKGMAASKTGTAAMTIGAGAVAEAANSMNSVLDQVKQAKGTLDDLGFSDHLGLLLHNPMVLICAAAVGLCVFIWFDRRSKLVNDHV